MTPDLDEAFSDVDSHAVRVPVVLASMPFISLNMPSLALGLLGAAQVPTGEPARTLYLNVPWARLIGERMYNEITGMDGTTSLIGEWLFSLVLDDWHATDLEAYVDEVLGRRADDHRADSAPLSYDIDDVYRATRLVEPFVERAAHVVSGCRPRLVGLTSTFQQHCASLALARKLKEITPETVVVIGGANVEAEMGYATVRVFDQVDAIVSGEGDLVWPEIVRRVMASRSFDDLPGVVTRRTGTLRLAATPLKRSTVEDLDTLPLPDFSPYFAQLGVRGLGASEGREARVEIPYESARGCWWGAKRHCTFCGLNGGGMAYRSKSPSRVLADLRALEQNHAEERVLVVDNILDPRYPKAVFPEFAASNPTISLFWETKSNLSPEDLEAMAAANVHEFQPGLESLVPSALRLMRKGATPAQQIRLLRDAQACGVAARWNWIWGFSGEVPAEYAAVADNLPLLHHLQPPASMSTIAVHRFSPLFDDPDSFGLHDIRPYRAYEMIYRHLAPEDIDDLAYHFAYRRDEGPPDSYVAHLASAIRRWQDAYHTSSLFLLDGDDGTAWAVDTREQRRPAVIALSPAEVRCLTACNDVVPRRQLVELHGESIVRSLVDRGLIFPDAARLVSLVVPLTAFSLHHGIELEEVVRRSKVEMVDAFLHTSVGIARRNLARATR